jgi:hypothetical protein
MFRTKRIDGKFKGFTWIPRLFDRWWLEFSFVADGSHAYANNTYASNCPIVWIGGGRLGTAGRKLTFVSPFAKREKIRKFTIHGEQIEP